MPRFPTVASNMSAQCEVTAKRATGSSMSLFERYLTLWVGLCIVVGIALGHWFTAPFQTIGQMEVAQVNLPVAVLIWLMIIPMLLKVDFGALHQVKEHWRGIGVTLFINWAVKPFSMALLGWLFIRGVFAPYLPADQLDSYIAGLILLAAAPCTAMVFVWSRLADGDANFTLTQVALNDSIMIFAFAPIVGLLLGLSAITVPWDTLFLSVVLYIVLPVLFAQGWRRRLLHRGGEPALQARLDQLHPLSLFALLATLVLLFGFQGEQILQSAPGHRHARRAHPDSGLLQLGACLSAQPPLWRGALCGGPFGTDWRKQLLRTRGGSGHRAVRFQLRRRIGHRGRRTGRGTGDAVGRQDRQRDTGLVPAWRL